MHGTWLSWIVFLPLIGAAAVMLLPQRFTRLVATLFAAAEVAIALPLWWRMDSSNGAWQFAELRDWIPSWGASYSLAVDGISSLLVLMTVVVTLIAVVGAFNSVDKRAREFFALILALETGMLGTFLATDLLLFYVFWEAMLIPMYLLIGVWGGQRRIYAALKFFLYTMVGSVLMLVAILWLYFHHRSEAGFATFALDAYYGLPLAAAAQTWLFLAFALAFAIKVPMFPFHTWLPDAHVEAPTAGSVILAAVLLKMGTYGFLRFAMPIFPVASAEFTPWIVALAIIGILYGALVAMVQPDLKKLVAYSSVSHLGFCMLGLYALNTQGITGAMLQMLNHGVSTGALFLLVGMIYERRHTRLIADFGGLWKPIPVFAVIFLIVMLSSIGLPGTNGFIGEFLVLLGAFRVNPWWAAAAAVGVILSACYMLWMFQRVVFGPVTHPENEKLTDLSMRERLVFAPLLVLIFWMGVAPQPFIDRMQASIGRTLQIVNVRTRTSHAMNDAPILVAPAAIAPTASGGTR
ncbi:MAG: NADH-quinone oxidoreductase subunit M [Candidatus Eisenbacteria bacterium]|uniref:NADH-quinone oxidoreductase subunit M n=1 Tax=Eiseniibacteriota bacterium TaxID=2212470 RepID=A0A849SPC7_UNCEI|nr:NADH-quinone oxidoreductase subunit M [Candidatus Eisenbacteria bacterium]